MMVFLYAVLVFLILRFCVTLFNFLSNPKLGYYGKHFTDQVSVIVLSAPAEGNLERLTESFNAQGYKDAELIVQQNESIAELVERAAGTYLLFITPETTLHHGLINSLIYRLKIFDLAVINVVPTYRASGFLAQCIYPLSDFLLLNLFPLRLIRLSNFSAFAAGSGNCLFFDAARYKQLSWNERPGTQLPPAAELVKQAKQQQFGAEVLLANKLLRQDVGETAARSVARQLLLNFSDSGIAALVYVALVVFGPLVVLFNFEPALLILPVGLIFLSRVMISFLTAQNPLRNVFLHPGQMVVLLLLVLKFTGLRIRKAIKLKK